MVATTAMRRNKKIKVKNPNETTSGSDNYTTSGERLTVDEKLKILQELGQPDLIDLFKEWKPRETRKKKAAPLDQRVTITVTDQEKLILDKELEAIRKAGESITMAQFIRNRAMGSVDVHGWKDRVTSALQELNDIDEHQAEIKKRIKELDPLIENIDDDEERAMMEIEQNRLKNRLGKLTAKSEKRNNRLSGRMSMVEAETVKWRAQRLCVSTSDYLRMMIFGLEPDSSADNHMSLDSKRRFYVSIIEVANNGWGAPSTVYECSQCANYVDEISRLQERVKQLEKFV